MFMARIDRTVHRFHTPMLTFPEYVRLASKALIKLISFFGQGNGNRSTISSLAHDDT